ncbi:MAG: hypothetical protein P8075_06330 [Deltaproteobacteria bacterium]
MKSQRSEVRRQKTEDRGELALSLSVITYLLFGRSVAMSFLHDFYDFYDLNGLNGLNDLPRTTDY